MKVDHNHDHEHKAWCEEFASVYRFETKLDISVCMSVARNAYLAHGSCGPTIAVRRVLGGEVSSACPAVDLGRPE
ncbi:hypothetical protein [Rhizobacter fulvus]